MYMCESRNFCQRGSTFDVFFCFLVAGGSKYHYKWAIIDLPVKCHLNGVFAGVPIMALKLNADLAVL